MPKACISSIFLHFANDAFVKQKRDDHEKAGKRLDTIGLIEMRANQKDISESIELDTSLPIKKCNLTSRNGCFKLLRTLKETGFFRL